jgi:hypothetical protein
VSIALPPLSTIGEKTASLAERLIDADVSAPVHLIRAKTALIEIRAQIVHSDIDSTINEELSTRLNELKRLTHQGAEQLSVMLASSVGALDNMQISTKFLLEDLSKIAIAINQPQHRLIGISNVAFFSPHVKVCRVKLGSYLCIIDMMSFILI